MADDQSQSQEPNPVPTDSANQGATPSEEPISSQVLKSAYNAFKKH